MTFNMARVSNVPAVSSLASTVTTDVTIRPLLDIAAPYSVIGQHELKAIASDLLPNWNGDLDIIPTFLEGRTKWQYSAGEPCSVESDVLGCVVLNAISDDSSYVMIRHGVLKGSSQWVLGRNVTTKGYILHAECNKLRLLRGDGSVRSPGR